jgi:hypothetical protein
MPLLLTIDAAYWAATWIDLAAGTTVVLKYPNVHLVLIAEKVTVGPNVTFTWERPTRSATPKSGEPAKPPAQPMATSIGKPPPGTGGTAGVPGGAGASGTNAGELEVWLLELSGSPAFDVRGQDGAQGGAGGDGGDGGDGARGVAETYGFLGFCRSAMGFGGDGGPGGRAGDGGPGGTGGNGGRFSFYAPQAIINAFLQNAYITVDGGGAGAGGIPGTPGAGGSGGALGDHPANCVPGNDPATGQPEVRTAGSAGAQGSPGSQGRTGSAGARGTLSIQPISANDFRRELLNPAIAAITPPNARQNDAVTITGRNFTNTDVVLVDNVVAPTTVVSDTATSLQVPNVPGGVRTVRVRQADGTLSNPGSFYVMPQILSASPEGLIRPGSTVRLNGSGFAPGVRVRVNNQDMATVNFVDPHTIDFTMVRPAAGITPNPTGESVNVQVVLGDGGPFSGSNTVQQVLDTFRIVVAGDSVAWGQGLRTPQKYSDRVEQAVRAARGEIGVYATVFAHSGGIIGVGDPTILPALNGEIPTSYPTVLQQVNSVSDPEQVELVLVTASINDVDVMNILNPFTGAATLTSLIETKCHLDMRTLLNTIAGGFPNARIVTTGYFQIISEQSDLAAVEALLIGLGLLVGSVLGGVVIGVFGSVERAQIAANCAQFQSESTAKITLAVAEANDMLAPAPARIFFADPMFGPANAALASQPWLFGINLDLSPQDDPLVSGPRASVCVAAGPARTQVEICKRASIGHPNNRGAEAFANAIIPLI